MCNTLDIWEITVKWGNLQGDVYEPSRKVAADSCGFFYNQASQLKNSLCVSKHAIAVLRGLSYS